MEQWKIKTDRSKCDKPSCPLPAEQEYHAVLHLPECLKVELCRQCFYELENSGQAMPFHWRVKRKSGGGKESSLDLESLRQLFDRLGEERAQRAEGGSEEEGSENAAGLRYLVALLLLRKRRLKMVDPQSPEQEAADLLVVDPRIPEMEPVALLAPDLGSERLASLRQELMEALGETDETQAE